MDSQIKQLIEKVRGLVKGHGIPIGITGTTHREGVMLDLYKSVSLLLRAEHTGNLKQQLDEAEAKTNIAQAMNAIGTTEFESIMVDIDNIRKGIK